MPSACATDDKVVVDTSCIVCRMPQGTVVEAVISELTPQQVSSLVKVAGLAPGAAPRAAADWKAAIAEAHNVLAVVALVAIGVGCGVLDPELVNVVDIVRAAEELELGRVEVDQLVGAVRLRVDFNRRNAAERAILAKLVQQQLLVILGPDLFEELLRIALAAGVFVDLPGDLFAEEEADALFDQRARQVHLDVIVHLARLGQQRIRRAAFKVIPGVSD
jgi:hypothetical protein